MQRILMIQYTIYIYLTQVQLYKCHMFHLIDLYEFLYVHDLYPYNINLHITAGKRFYTNPNTLKAQLILQ